MKIVVTGATGYFGRELIRQLLGEGIYQLYASTSDIPKAQKIFGETEVEIISNESLLSNRGG